MAVTKTRVSTSLDDTLYQQRSASYDWRCKSKDTKPTENIRTNDLLLEVDTGKIYYFEDEINNWKEVGGKEEEVEGEE